MKKVYEIVEYNLIGKKLYTCKERPDLEMRIIDKRECFFHAGTNTKVFESHLWKYSTTPKTGAISPDEQVMPYFADVTEDIPGSCKDLKPKTYKNCQLLTEKHGGYLQFWHEPTKQVLRIAMNSHIYKPKN